MDKEKIRERLVELISKTPCIGDESKTAAEHVADHLVANGVTVQEWIPVSERLPEVNTEVLGFLWGTTIDIVWLNGRTGKWRSECVNKHEEWEITHWMPLPTPPKEDDNA